MAPAVQAAAPAAAALEVAGLPPTATPADLHALVSQFCAVDRVVAVYPSSSSSGGGSPDSGDSAGCALVLLRPAADWRCGELAATAADLLDCYPLDGGLLDVKLCQDPRAWLQEATGLQSMPAAQPLPPPVPPASQHDHPGEEQQPSAGPASEAAAAAAPAGCPARSPTSTVTLDEAFDSPEHEQEAGADSEGEWCQAPQRRGGSGSGKAGQPGGPPCCALVVHNVCPDFTAQQLGDFLCGFGPLEQCIKPFGAPYVLVRYSTAEAAAAAKEALHDALVEELNPDSPVAVSYRTGSPQRLPLSLRQHLASEAPLPQPPEGNPGTELVVHNLLVQVEGRDVAAVFRRFGAVAKCVKRAEARYAFVSFADADAAAAALATLHGKVVPELNPRGELVLDYRRSPSGGSGGDGRGGGGHGGRSGRTTPDSAPSWRR